MSLALAVALCVFSALAIASWGAPRNLSRAHDLLLRSSLSIPFGVGLFSVTFIVTKALRIGHPIAVDVSIVVLLAVAYGAAARRRNLEPFAGDQADRQQSTPCVLVIAFGIALAIAAYCAVVRIVAFSHGDGWDAFAIWNLHARFLFRGGANWRDGFSPLIPWSHPDYPLLLPAAVAHFWDYLGHESPIIPGLIALAFTFSTAGLLFSALLILRGTLSATLATLALLATPAFITQGTSQYADVPLSTYFLATIALLCLHSGVPEQARRSWSLLVLAGISASFAAWAKNEGLLFLCATAAAILFAPICRFGAAQQKQLGWTSVAAFCLGVAPISVLIVWFKHSLAPAGDLFTNPADAFGKLHEGRRYWVIVRWFAKDFFRFGDWLVVPGSLLLAAIYLIFRAPKRDALPAAVRLSIAGLAFTLAGYFAIYLITPYDLDWHLRFSLNRLFLQLWPSAIFIFFLALPLDRRMTTSQTERAKMGIL